MTALHICHSCYWLQRPCSGPCACLKDGRDIIAHAKHDYCPIKKYGTDVEPESWVSVPRVLFKSPEELEAMLKEQGVTIDGAKREARHGCCDPPQSE